ncbi:fungal-specific transcription factor domain-containing protein [Aspergillus multicolor]|uniref:fungal specific transcription factor domain-containing protein n=1 Tax=Aspergillus multicolor TaxID=41759 RepID=UPI003CCE2EC2
MSLEHVINVTAESPKECDGLLPCRPCTLNSRNCSRQTTDMRRRSAKSQVGAAQKDNIDGSSTTIGELAARVDQLDQLVHSKLQALPFERSAHHPSEFEGQLEAAPPQKFSLQESSVATSGNKRSVRGDSVAFSGETSIRYTLTQLERDLVRAGGTPEYLDGSPSRKSTPALTPAPSPGVECSQTSGIALDMHNALRKYGVEASKPQWDTYLDTFCNAIHTMYPFLHLPSLWCQYNEMWQSWSAERSFSDTHCGRDEQIAVAQVLICLAVGRCTTSPRVAGAEARHSAGWSLYSAATDLFGDILSSFEECSNQILVLQTLALMVVYLFRLDIVAKAEKILALAISHAHYQGLHRCKTTITGTAPREVETEICRRVWWCLYMLDRRLAIDTGRPFLIQDLNVNTPLPHSLPDDQLHYQQVELGFDPRPEASTSSATPLAYLTAMVAYSTVLGKVWEGIYSAKNVETAPSSHLVEHLEHLISRVQEGIPYEFTYHPWQRKALPQSVVWWLARQQTLMRVRWLSLGLLIRKPVLRQPHRASPPNNLQIAGVENELIMLQLSHQLINECLGIPLEQAIFTYPFLHYLISAAIVSLGLIIKERTYRDAYGNRTRHAIQVMESYCRRTWVSGKMVRDILKLSRIIERVLPGAGSHDPNASEKHPAGNGALFRQNDPPPVGGRSPNPITLPGHLHLPVQQAGIDVDERIIASANMEAGPPHANPHPHSGGLTALEVDFYFEGHAPRRHAHPGTSSICSPRPLTHSHSQVGAGGAEVTARCRPLGENTRYLASGTAVGQGPDIADREDGAAEEMQWLEALFGGYLDSDLIIRPGE